MSVSLDGVMTYLDVESLSLMFASTTTTAIAATTVENAATVAVLLLLPLLGVHFPTKHAYA